MLLHLCDSTAFLCLLWPGFTYMQHTTLTTYTLSGTTQLSQYQKKRSPTHTYWGHQSSLICFIHLLWSMASSPFNLSASYVFFHNLSPSCLWSTFLSSTLYFILHTFLLPITLSSFAAHAYTICNKCYMCHDASHAVHSASGLDFCMDSIASSSGWSKWTSCIYIIYILVIHAG